MRRISILLFGSAIASLSCFAQLNKPKPEVIVDNKIHEMIAYCYTDFSEVKFDTILIKFDSMGNEVSHTAGKLGVLTSGYVYDFNGRPLYRIDFNGNHIMMDSVAYVYFPNGTHTEYTFKPEDLVDGKPGPNWKKHYATYDKDGNLILKVSVNKYNYYFYNNNGDEIRDSVRTPNSATRATVYTPTYDINGKMIKRTWLSKKPDNPNVETFEYNSQGLLSKYTRLIYGTNDHFNWKEEYIYK